MFKTEGKIVLLYYVNPSNKYDFYVRRFSVGMRSNKTKLWNKDQPCVLRFSSYFERSHYANVQQKKFLYFYLKIENYIFPKITSVK